MGHPNYFASMEVSRNVMVPQKSRARICTQAPLGDWVTGSVWTGNRISSVPFATEPLIDTDPVLLKTRIAGGISLESIWKAPTLRR